jgi:hypothetical protein
VSDLFLSADWICGRPERMTGGNLIIVRNALGHDRHSLAVELETTERHIQEAELTEGFIPEKLDLRARELFLGYSLTNASRR